MSYTFQISKIPVPTKPPTKNVYKLVIENMSGDADNYAYPHEFFTPEELPLISEFLDFVDWMNSDYKNLRKAWEKFNSLSDKLSQSDLLQNDVTRQEMPCNIKFASLTYFDENSVEYPVNIRLAK